MKIKSILLAGVFALTALAIPFPTETAFAGWGCGLPPLTPLTPLGCKSMEPQCVCDNTDNCHWEFVCVH